MPSPLTQNTMRTIEQCPYCRHKQTIIHNANHYRAFGTITPEAYCEHCGVDLTAPIAAT